VTDDDDIKTGKYAAKTPKYAKNMELKPQNLQKYAVKFLFYKNV
jgi:hypothetical protein